MLSHAGAEAPGRFTDIDAISATFAALAEEEVDAEPIPVVVEADEPASLDHCCFQGMEGDIDNHGVGWGCGHPEVSQRHGGVRFPQMPRVSAHVTHRL